MKDAPLVLNTRDARGVVTLTLNRAQAFNALSEGMLESLQRLQHAFGQRVEGLRPVQRQRHHAARIALVQHQRCVVHRRSPYSMADALFARSRN